MNAGSPSFHPPRRGGYTLLELLLAITILLILAAIVVAGLRSFRENLHLTRAGQIMVDQVGAARQLASAHNWTVYVYLYKVPATSPVGYSALQLWRCAPPSDTVGSPVMLPVAQPYFLPSAVVISEDATHNSPLLGVLAAQGSPPPLANLPPSLASATYMALAIRPSGTLALGGDTSAAGTLATCCLMVVPTRFGAQTAAPPNFVTVQINPGAGVPLVYRP